MVKAVKSLFGFNSQCKDILHISKSTHKCRGIEKEAFAELFRIVQSVTDYPEAVHAFWIINRTIYAQRRSSAQLQQQKMWNLPSNCGNGAYVLYPAMHETSTETICIIFLMLNVRRTHSLQAVPARLHTYPTHPMHCSMPISCVTCWYEPENDFVSSANTVNKGNTFSNVRHTLNMQSCFIRHLEQSHNFTLLNFARILLQYSGIYWLDFVGILFGIFLVFPRHYFECWDMPPPQPSNHNMMPRDRLEQSVREHPELFCVRCSQQVIGHPTITCTICGLFTPSTRWMEWLANDGKERKNG